MHEDLKRRLAEIERGESKRTLSEYFVPAQVRVDDSASLVSCINPHNDQFWYNTLASCGQQFAPCYLTPFPGYPYLAQLRQDVLYRNVITAQAEEMTFKWLQLESGDEQTLPSETVQAVADVAIEKWKVDAFVRDAWGNYFGWDGGGLIFIDIVGHESDEMLASELIIDEAHIGQGDLRGFRVVEAINCAPYDYDAANPLSPDYYNPRYWLILGKKVHRSRFLHFVQNRLPALLKPVYNFFGVPLPQLLQPYRDGFERARNASLRSIENHALLYVKTNMQKMMQYGCDDANSLPNRIRLMEMTRSNDGIAVVDRDSEEFQQITTPLTDLADLTSQNLELFAAVTRQKVTKFLGTPPHGFNTQKSEAEKTDQAEVTAQMQRDLLHDNVVKMYELIQLNEFGQIFRPIRYSWPSTAELTESEKLDAEHKRAQIDQIYLSDGPHGPVVIPNETRRSLASDKNSRYFGIEYDEAEGYYEEIENAEAEAEMSAAQLGGVGNGEESTEAAPQESRPDNGGGFGDSGGVS